MRDSFAAIEHIVPPDLRQGLAILLSQSADPAYVVSRLESLHAARQAEFHELLYTPFGLQALVAIFSTSRFLSREVEDHPAWLLEILQSGSLHRARLAEEMEEDLESWLGGMEGVPPAVRLAQFRRKQVLRILLRDVLGFGGLAEITEELSHLADVLIHTAYRRLRQSLSLTHGAPLDAAGRPCGMSIVAAGKLGGRELNYSSDIDLIFLHSGDGTTRGPAPLSSGEFFKRTAIQLTRLLGQATPEGLIYRVDLRLRPEGGLGEICPSVQTTKNYYQTRARDWELQMLIKARVAAGDAEPGRSFLEWVQPRIYSSSLDFRAVERMSETREKMDEKLGARRRGAGIDVKLAPGGIRDIEFLVQCLQRLYGGREAWLRNTSTLLALMRLRDKNLLSGSEYSRLATAYQFLRYLEHRLQLDEDRQTHILSLSRDELAIVARRMPPDLMDGEASAETLLRTLECRLAEVRSIYERIIHAQQPAPVAPPPSAGAPVDDRAAPPPSSNLIRFLDQRAPRFAAAVRRARPGKSLPALEHFIERILPQEDWMRALDDDPVLAGYLLDLFAHSPFFAEQLSRQPAYFEEIRSLRADGALAADFAREFERLDDAAAIRRRFLRRMFRLQAESICLQWPVFETLERVSHLADQAIAACYRLALSEASPAPCPPLMAIALGRLGMQEFDLASDADLVFVLPDEAAGELSCWTRAAERLISMLASYTGDGTMFSVDHRLCPNGRAGALVQTEAAYRDYFARKAEAWEGIAYMKARAVAGPLDRATAFLADLQNIDWRRYGQSGRSRNDLRQMRLRLERELGQQNPLKSGAGGYYDIDFALMYLRLRGAGLFFKVLNTPARIQVLEQMGHLDAGDARFLMDAATFYRAVDHGLRLISGHTEGMLPTSAGQKQLLTALVRRWVPPHLCDQPLEAELLQIQQRTRAFFDRLFSETSHL